jgi:predicted permease
MLGLLLYLFFTQMSLHIISTLINNVATGQYARVADLIHLQSFAHARVLTFYSVPLDSSAGNLTVNYGKLLVQGLGTKYVGVEQLPF